MTEGHFMKLLLDQSKENGADLKRLHREVGELSTRLKQVEVCLQREIKAVEQNEADRLKRVGAVAALDSVRSNARDGWARWTAVLAILVSVAGVTLPAIM